MHYTEDKLRISVLDFGIGIPPNETHRLFAAFQRGSNTADIPGTGLGLATAKEFVELNLGTIYYNEKQKSGTEFCIEFPVEKEL